MNKFIGNGRLTKDIELRVTKNGTAVGSFTLAINRTMKNENGEYDTDFLNCTVFGKQAETMQKYTQKGSKIAVEGRIQTGSYEKDGQTRYTTDIMVERVEFLDSRTSAKNTQVEEKPRVEQRGFTPKEMEITDDMLPF